MQNKPLLPQAAWMPRALGRLAVCALAVASLAGCSTISEKWSQWRGKDSQPAAVAKIDHPVLRPSVQTERWQGLFSYQADAGRFQDCRTGQTVSVLMEGDNVLLENAYMASRHGGPAVPMLATVDGKVLEQPSADPVMAQQGHKQLVLRVERFVSLSSASSCASGWQGKQGAAAPEPIAAPSAPAAPAVALAASATGAVAEKSAAPAAAVPVSLENTNWKLLTLNGKAVPAQGQTAQLNLLARGKLAGSGGCNRIMGSWRQKGERLQFGQVATTRMACLGAAAHTEEGLLKVLERTAGWRVHGDRLELLDAKGKLLAQLQAEAAKP
ncbi:MAG: META domain-containing protein [Acidovorax sp.]|nr:META domain-containing protein [Acidovorax sp.]